jgi:ubiquinone/menaquinone biosynthesis C-methylase UbiE
MKYQKHKEHFETAYKTGTDVWTHIPIKERGHLLMEQLSPDSFVLDVGSGRGLFAKQLAEAGFRVIGIDFESNIVRKTNENIPGWNLQDKLKFVVGDALDIPFEDNSFDGVCDFGLMENLFQEDWDQYASEVYRVLKPGGYYLNTSFSSETQSFFEFNPKASSKKNFEKYGVTYHFFSKDEMKGIFDKHLIPVKQDIDFPDRPNEIALLETLFKKSK